MKPLVYIIILNWNGKELIIDCLESISKVKYENYKVMVVDNDSDDDSVLSIREKHSGVEILELDRNYGFAGGNNRGFEAIKNRKADYVIFLNNDTTVNEEFIDPLITSLENNKSIGQTVPKIHYSDDKKIWYAGGIINHWTGIIKHVGIRKIDSQKFNQENYTDYATGCCFAIRFRDFEKVSGFDTSYPMYCEDVDLSLRLRLLGRKIRYVPSSIIYHKVSSSIGGELSIAKIRRKILGYLKLFWNHSNDLQKISIPLVWIIRSPFILLKYLYLIISKK